MRQARSAGSACRPTATRILQRVPRTTHTHHRRPRLQDSPFAAQSHPSPTTSLVDDDPCKQFSVKTLTDDTINQASVVITRAFAASPQYIPIDECKTYCKDMLSKDEAEGIIFVGAIAPGPDCQKEPEVVSQESTTPTPLRKNSSNRVVATASVSFCNTSRENFKSLSPPNDAPYLCNIAVDPAFRRKGLARRMLAHVENYCREKGWKSIYLHVRLGDNVARSLYDSSGYEELAADSWLIKLQNRTPNALLCKRL